MAKKRIKLSEQIRQAIKQSGLSRYAICKAIGMDQAIMSRFMNGKGGLQQDSLDAVADLLGLELKPVNRVGKGKVKNGKFNK
jgi:predicted XRE-type DNA-binding protein